MRTCSVANCNKEHVAKNYCTKHYEQFRKYGKVLKHTRYDFNEVVDKGSHYELILMDNYMNELGRAKIDKSDLELIKKYGRWGLDPDGYVYNSKYKVKMHRIIMGAEDYQFIDHKKVGIKYRSDNRRKNLRLCTKSQNGFNSNKRKHNTSGYKGVSLMKNGKFRATIVINKKQKWLGSFDNPKLAYLAYCEASKNFHKQFGRIK